MAGRGKLIAVMGDEDTVTGFLLGGIGELDKHRRPNFLVVEKETSLAEIEETFRGFLAREDVGMILISQALAEQIRPAVAAHARALPAVPPVCASPRGMPELSPAPVASPHPAMGDGHPRQSPLSSQRPQTVLHHSPDFFTLDDCGSPPWYPKTAPGTHGVTSQAWGSPPQGNLPRGRCAPCLGVPTPRSPQPIPGCCWGGPWGSQSVLRGLWLPRGTEDDTGNLVCH
ncbi:V-type proton ATPase subunit F [Taeniopygia guttata]|uniref:V-ATPase 14 kDa subunit n=1 Tax=Taeniopygia guttata TaxID=59729 RepID=B5G4A4_TAEGU|nr:V-type proton ATPase subunit F [Taeniopygia guttata]ACH46115.1 putative Vacuolar ATP synthase subunit F variant 1 [Taeniopygia guttata]ACH46116.1 putative Vacuolar ATP synthase subunit F variant 1 [Taeniopygia guttata]